MDEPGKIRIPIKLVIPKCPHCNGKHEYPWFHRGEATREEMESVAVCHKTGKCVLPPQKQITEATDEQVNL